MPYSERNEYSKEFKLTAVHLMKSGLFKPREVFTMLGGIDRQTVCRWVKDYEKMVKAHLTVKRFYRAAN